MPPSTFTTARPNETKQTRGNRPNAISDGSEDSRWLFLETIHQRLGSQLFRGWEFIEQLRN